MPMVLTITKAMMVTTIIDFTIPPFISLNGGNLGSVLFKRGVELGFCICIIELRNLISCHKNSVNYSPITKTQKMANVIVRKRGISFHFCRTLYCHVASCTQVSV